MKYRFEYQPYRRHFVRPLVTAHGSWKEREGLIVRLEREDGAFGFGEIAPVPWFGTESFDKAWAWCREQSEWEGAPAMVPEDLPCCQWAVESANQSMEEKPIKRVFHTAALITDAHSFRKKQQAGFQTFKLKIGAGDITAEMEQLDSLLSQLEEGQCFRLDANGGLSEPDFIAWLEYLEGKPIDFLEQALEPGLENRMLEIAEPFSTLLALDESVAGLDSLKLWKNWPGVLVVKPSLLGWIGEGAFPDFIGSSVFETAFGFEVGLQFLARHQKSDTAIGYDTNALLEEDGWSLHGSSPLLVAGEVSKAQLQTLWKEKCETIS